MLSAALYTRQPSKWSLVVTFLWFYCRYDLFSRLAIVGYTEFA